jgi:hypothetical protein
VDDVHVFDADALWHGQDNVPSSTRAGGGAISGCAGAVGETWEVADGGFQCRGMPAGCTAWRKISVRMSWYNLVCAARVEHRLPWSVSVQRRVALQPHCTSGA